MFSCVLLLWIYWLKMLNYIKNASFFMAFPDILYSAIDYVKTSPSQPDSMDIAVYTIDETGQIVWQLVSHFQPPRTMSKFAS